MNKRLVAVLTLYAGLIGAIMFFLPLVCPAEVITTYNVDELTGGAERALDYLSVDDLSDKDRAIYSAKGRPKVFRYFMYDSSGTTPESTTSSPYIIRPDDYATQGVWVEQVIQQSSKYVELAAFGFSDRNNGDQNVAAFDAAVDYAETVRKPILFPSSSSRFQIGRLQVNQFVRGFECAQRDSCTMLFEESNSTAFSIGENTGIPNAYLKNLSFELTSASGSDGIWWCNSSKGFISGNSVIFSDTGASAFEQAKGIVLTSPRTSSSQHIITWNRVVQGRYGLYGGDEPKTNADVLVMNNDFSSNVHPVYAPGEKSRAWRLINNQIRQNAHQSWARIALYFNAEAWYLEGNRFDAAGGDYDDPHSCTTASYNPILIGENADYAIVNLGRLWQEDDSDIAFCSLVSNYQFNMGRTAEWATKFQIKQKGAGTVPLSLTQYLSGTTFNDSSNANMFEIERGTPGRAWMWAINNVGAVVHKNQYISSVDGVLHLDLHKGRKFTTVLRENLTDLKLTGTSGDSTWMMVQIRFLQSSGSSFTLPPYGSWVDNSTGDNKQFRMQQYDAAGSALSPFGVIPGGHYQMFGFQYEPGRWYEAFRTGWIN